MVSELQVVHLGCGVCGLVCAEQLARNPRVAHLILADARTDAAGALARRIRSAKVSIKKVDGTDPDVLRSLLKGCDLVVAAMPWRLNKTVMEVAARVGTNYVDFGMPLDSTGPEFECLAKMCADAGIAALVGMGSEPGISDVFAMHAATRLDRVDEAHIYDGDTTSVDGVAFFSPWSRREVVRALVDPEGAVWEDRS